VDINQLARHLTGFTCPLFKIKVGSTELPELFGNSILFEYNGSYYCFSNAHITGDQEKLFNIVGGKTKTYIGGEFLFSRIPSSGNRKDDNLDICVVKLSDRSAQGLLKKGYYFLPIDKVNVGNEEQPKERLLFVGYPASKIDKDYVNKNITIKPFLLLTHIYSRNVNLPSYTKEHHIFAPYSIGKVENLMKEVRRGPNPPGMSGCGLWLLKPDGDNFDYRLLGIFSEYHSNRSLLIGTRINLYIELIKQRFDSTIITRGSKIIFR
jgi:hypothetical protein